MSSLLRRMQRMSKRGPSARKSALNRNFATRLGIGKDAGKSLLKPGRPPKALRRSKNSQKWLDARAAARTA
jgi:hypothetical protein